MTTRIRNINPLQLGIVYAVLYALLGVIIGVCFALIGMVASSMAPSGAFSFGWLSVIIFPILYAVIGFIAGLIVGFLYNLVAGWTGGIELTFTTSPVGAAAP
jgi:ABC-type polysaccharide/polyol phosphate export permease